MAFYERLKEYTSSIIAAPEYPPRDRAVVLADISGYVRRCLGEGRESRLTFVCTHNSRRSQMAQVWAQTAAAWYGIRGVLAFSGGTEATKFEPRAVGALQRAGYRIDTDGGGDNNPVYRVRYATDTEPITCFSKTYDDASNPAKDYCAVMTCSEADRGCPVVAGAEQRLSIPYADPRTHDGTDLETEKYDECCARIAAEMLYVFSLVHSR